MCNKKLITPTTSKSVFQVESTISHTGNYFLLSSGGETIVKSFEARIVHEKLSSELVFAQSVRNKMRLSSLAYGIVYVNKRVTYHERDACVKT